MINGELKRTILEHIESEYPREACGLLVNVDGKPIYWPCKNEAENKDYFILSPIDYAKAEDAGEIIALIHSHPDGNADPSQADMVACEASGLRWYVVSYPDVGWAYIEPSGYKAPLIGRQFFHGVLDCYSLIRDWYRQERGIDLLDFPRRDVWWKNGGNLYVDNFAKAGFYRVDEDDLKEGDVILMQVMSNVPNHGAIYIGNNSILHHLHGALSCREVYGGYWQKHTTHVLRHGAEKDSSDG
jgi:proteasome lid subunit RPN8/RPN11